MNKLLYISFIFCLLFCGCVASTEESIRIFENRLESFIGKSVRQVINELGKPTRYLNKQDSNAKARRGTYMIYDYRPKGDDCIIMLKFAKKTLKVIDWDYNGNCLFMDGK